MKCPFRYDGRLDFKEDMASSSKRRRTDVNAPCHSCWWGKNAVRSWSQHAANRTPARRQAHDDASKFAYPGPWPVV